MHSTPLNSSSTHTCALLCSSAAACKSRPTHMWGCSHSREPARGWWHLCREPQGLSSCCRSASCNACVPAPAAQVQQPSVTCKLIASATGPVQQLRVELTCLTPGLPSRSVRCNMQHCSALMVHYCISTLSWPAAKPPLLLQSTFLPQC